MHDKRHTKTNEFWQIWAKPEEPGKPGKKRAFLGKNVAKLDKKKGETGQKKTAERNRTLAKQGETESFAECWIASP